MEKRRQTIGSVNWPVEWRALLHSILLMKCLSQWNHSNQFNSRITHQHIDTFVERVRSIKSQKTMNWHTFFTDEAADKCRKISSGRFKIDNSKQSASQTMWYNWQNNVCTDSLFALSATFTTAGALWYSSFHRQFYAHFLPLSFSCSRFFSLKSIHYLLPIMNLLKKTEERQ